MTRKDLIVANDKVTNFETLIMYHYYALYFFHVQTKGKQKLNVLEIFF